MKIKTVEKLADHLDHDLGWRKKELTYIVTSINDEKNINAELRIGMAILYAHWEGYIKKAGSYYILYIGQLELKYEELSENFIALALKNTLSTCIESNKISIHTKLVNILINDLSTKAPIPYYHLIDAKSNLNWEVFKEIMDTLGLESSFYITKDKQVNKLVRNRNDVAHGQRVCFDKEEFLDLYKDIINILDSFKEQIIQSASSESFKRSTDN